MPQQVARNVTESMKDVPDVRASIAVAGGRAQAGKTGTVQHPNLANQNKDAWMVGYTPSVSTAVWVGTDTSEPDQERAGSPGVRPHAARLDLAELHERRRPRHPRRAVLPVRPARRPAGRRAGRRVDRPERRLRRQLRTTSSDDNSDKKHSTTRRTSTTTTRTTRTASNSSDGSTSSDGSSSSDNRAPGTTRAGRRLVLLRQQRRGVRAPRRGSLVPRPAQQRCR